MDYVPQRLHNVCDLLWRLPNDEVPFAVVQELVVEERARCDRWTYSWWIQGSCMSD